MEGQLVADGIGLGLGLGVEGVLSAAGTHNHVEAQAHGILIQGLHHLVAGYVGELHRQVVDACALHTDTAIGHHDVAGLHIGAGAHATLMQFLDTDGVAAHVVLAKVDIQHLVFRNDEVPLFYVCCICAATCVYKLKHFAPFL